MRLILLGTSGYHPSDARQTACLMLPELGVLFDAGTSLYRLADYLATDTLDIFLTHAHLDHIAGLTYLLGLEARCPLRRTTVHAAAEVLEAVERHLFAPALFPVPPSFERKVLGEETTIGGTGRLRHFRLTHPGGAVGFRLDTPGRSLAYVTDTTAGPDVDYRQVIEGVDLLVHECYFAADEQQLARRTGHSCLTDVVGLAAEARVGQLVLVHVHPHDGPPNPSDLVAARRIFSKTEVGLDRGEYHY